jgi:hypothetical protein
VKANETSRLPAVATNDVGALAVVEGVAVTVLEAVPVPTRFIAETLKVYSVPFDRDVTVSEVRVLTDLEKSFHVDPEFEEYWTK